MENKKFKGIYLESPGKQPQIKEFDLYTVEKDGDILIKIEASPINPCDIYIIKGSIKGFKPYPGIIGSEGVGKVVSGKGEQAEKLIGKRVGFNLFNTSHGTYSEYCIGNVAQTIVLPEDMPAEQAACSFINPFTVKAMYEKAKSCGAKAIVHNAAAGQVGRMLVKYVQKKGIEVINIVRKPEQVKILKDLGAKYVLNETDQDFAEQLQKLSEELKATVFFDAVAGSATRMISENLPVKTQIFGYGQLSFKDYYEFSVISGGFKQQSLGIFSLFELFTLLPTEQEISEAIQEIGSLLQTDFKTKISKVYTLDQFDEALEYYKQNMTKGKVVIKIQ